MSRYKWERVGKMVEQNGTTITYSIANFNIDIVVESRKRKIPHANRVGFWEHTTYWVVVNGADYKERYSLADAKRTAEELIPGAFMDNAEEIRS